MKKAILKPIAIFFCFMGFFLLQRVLFLAFYQHLTHADAGDWLSVLYHGLSMDASVAGYLTIIPGLLVIASIWTRQKAVRIAEKVYFAVVAFILACVTLLDLVLYGYWGFRLDTTPIFYFTSSPSAAMASAEWWQLPVGAVAIAAITFGLYKAFVAVARHFGPPYPKKIPATVCVALLTVLLFIPIRGGVTVSTMNLSRAYFSSNVQLNHAAVNPQFSLLSSAFQQHDFANQFRFFSDAESDSLFESLEKSTLREPSDSLANDISVTLTENRPDIYLIIMESFSSHLFKSLGGTDVAAGLDSIAAGGILFTDIYASSFRTDRSLPAILSGFPGQPTMSLMKYVDKMESLPSISAELKDAGYETGYYYGGDINFTNMNSFLVHSKFDRIVSDKDFPVSQRMGKWGAPDGPVFERAFNDISGRAGDGKPTFTVIQTSSSHEPYDVPYESPKFKDNKKLNAFAYADRCAADFITRLSSLPGYSRSLVIIVPDHFGVWPEDLEEIAARHRVPLIMTGGALANGGKRISTVGNQTDIAATLLTMLGMPADKFEFSHNLLDPRRAGYAFISDRGAIGLITPDGKTVYDLEAERVTAAEGKDATEAERRLKAYLQHLYTRISKM